MSCPLLFRVRILGLTDLAPMCHHHGVAGNSALVRHNRTARHPLAPAEPCIQEPARGRMEGVRPGRQEQEAVLQSRAVRRLVIQGYEASSPPTHSPLGEPACAHRAVCGGWVRTCWSLGPLAAASPTSENTGQIHTRRWTVGDV